MRINAEAKKIVAMAEFGMIPDQEPDRVFLFG